MYNQLFPCKKQKNRDASEVIDLVKVGEQVNSGQSLLSITFFENSQSGTARPSSPASKIGFRNFSSNHKQRFVMRSIEYKVASRYKRTS